MGERSESDDEALIFIVALKSIFPRFCVIWRRCPSVNVGWVYYNSLTIIRPTLQA